MKNMKRVLSMLILIIIVIQVFPKSCIVHAVALKESINQKDNSFVRNEIEVQKNSTEEVEENETPKAIKERSWALMNFVFTIFTLILGLTALFIKDKENDNDIKIAKSKRNKKITTKVLSTLIMFVSVIIFVFTEDMTLSIVMVDKWTITMFSIALVQIAVFMIGNKWNDNEIEDEIVMGL